MIAMERGVGFGVLAGRVLGLMAVGGGWLLSAGAGAGMAQATSSVTFNYLNQTRTDFNAKNTPTSGTVTYLGTGGTPTANQPGNDFWGKPVIDPNTGQVIGAITGIQFVNSPTYNYSTLGNSSGPSNFTNFSQFYFLGACSICGDGITTPPSNSFIKVADSLGTTLIQDPIPGLLAGYLVTNSGGPINIEYGDTGQTGTISFNTSNIVAIDQTVGIPGNGFISFTVNQSNKVPGPLPILGASTAFAFSRKLRRRVASAIESKITGNILA